MFSNTFDGAYEGRRGANVDYLGRVSRRGQGRGDGWVNQGTFLNACSVGKVGKF